MTLQHAVESTFAQVLARFVTPALLTAAIAMGGYIWRQETGRADRVESKLDAALTQVHDLQVREAFRDAKMQDIERRLNSPRSPIAEVTYGWIR